MTQTVSFLIFAALITSPKDYRDCAIHMKQFDAGLNSYQHSIINLNTEELAKLEVFVHQYTDSHITCSPSTYDSELGKHYQDILINIPVLRAMITSYTEHPDSIFGKELQAAYTNIKDASNWLNKSLSADSQR